MNKDTIVASIIGLCLGLIAAIVLWILPHYLHKSNLPKDNTANTTIISTASPSPVINNLISSPKDGEISKEKSIQISGNASHDKTVIISTNTDNQIITPNPDGSYSSTINLQEGANNIVVTTLNNNMINSESIYVYYFDETI